MKFSILLVVCLAACSDGPTAPLAPMRIELPDTVFAIGDRVLAIVRNESRADALFYHCDGRIPVQIEQREGTDWKPYHRFNSGGCDDIYPSGIMVVPPGQPHFENFVVDVRGEFRVRVDTGTRSGNIGSHFVYSSPYRVK